MGVHPVSGRAVLRMMSSACVAGESVVVVVGVVVVGRKIVQDLGSVAW